MAKAQTPRPTVGLWSRIGGGIALVAALAMLVWAILDIVNNRGVSEIVLDVFTAAVLVGVGTTLLGVWRTKANPVGVDARESHDAENRGAK